MKMMIDSNDSTIHFLNYICSKYNSNDVDCSCIDKNDLCLDYDVIYKKNLL